MRKLIFSIATLASLGGVAGAQYYGDRPYQPYRGDRPYAERRYDRLTQRQQARIELERRLAACGDNRWCRKHARREYRRDLARIDRWRF